MPPGGRSSSPGTDIPHPCGGDPEVAVGRRGSGECAAAPPVCDHFTYRRCRSRAAATLAVAGKNADEVWGLHGRDGVGAKDFFDLR